MLQGTYEARWQKFLDEAGFIKFYKHSRPPHEVWINSTLARGSNLTGLTKAFMNMRLPCDQGAALVDDWDCLRVGPPQRPQTLHLRGWTGAAGDVCSKVAEDR